MGDEAAEDLFILAAETGIENISVILAPVDLRIRDVPESTPELPPWAGELYDAIRKELEKLGGPAATPRPPVSAGSPAGAN